MAMPNPTALAARCDRRGHVPAAKNVENRLRKNRLDKNLQRAAADQSGVVFRFVVQVERHLPRLLDLHHFLCRRPYVRFHAAAADCPGDRAIFAHQHPRAFIARNRAIGVDDGRERASLARSPHPHDLFE